MTTDLILPAGDNPEMDSREAEAALFRFTETAYERGFKQCELEVRLALGGHSTSELWGEHGLLTATMKCVQALQSQQAKDKPCCGRSERDCDCEPLDAARVKHC